MPKLTEANLRDARDDVTKRIADQERAWGMSPTSSDPLLKDEFIQPILRKIEVDAANEKPIQQASQTNKHKQEGEWYGEPNHSPVVGKVRGKPLPKQTPNEKISVTSEVIGDFIYNRKTNSVRAMEATSLPCPPSMAESLIQELMAFPDWRAQFVEVSALCAAHWAKERGCAKCEVRERRYHEIMVLAVRAFGDPLAPLERKVISS